MGAFDEEYMVGKTVEKKIEYLKQNIVSKMQSEGIDYSSAFNNIFALLNHDNLFVAWLPIIKYDGKVYTADAELTSDEIKEQLDAGCVVIVFAPTKENNKLEWKCKIIN
jgi:hypothetical protein